MTDDKQHGVHLSLGTISAIISVVGTFIFAGIRIGEQTTLIERLNKESAKHSEVLERIEEKVNRIDLGRSGDHDAIENSKADLKDHNRRIEDLERSRRR